MTKKLRILSVYEGFFSGGARILHTDVILGLQQLGHQNTVLSINSHVFRENTEQPMYGDKCYKKLVENGIPVKTIGRRGNAEIDTSAFLDHELQILKDEVAKADVILTLKEQPLRLLKQIDVRKPVIACLHRSDPENQGVALSDLIEGVNKQIVNASILCARTARDAYAEAGVTRDAMKVVINGVDLSAFKHLEKDRKSIRGEYDITRGAPVIVFAARFDHMKNVKLFVKAARMFLYENPKAHIFMCGTGMDTQNAELNKILKYNFLGVESMLKRVHLLGVRLDMPKIYSAADIVSSTSSFGEAYPLCLLEGMACRTIPVTTNVGDTKYMLQAEKLGILTKEDPRSVADAWHLAHAKRNLYRSNIIKVRASFDRKYMVERYERVIKKTHSRYVKLTSQKPTEPSILEGVL